MEMDANKDDFDYEQHERLRSRVANNMDSLLWTFKQHYTAGDIYSRIDIGITALSAVLAGILTYSLIWENAMSVDWMVGITISIAVLTGFSTAARPQKRAEAHFDAGGEYHDLFERFRDYTQIKLADKDYGLESMETEYRRLAEERREMNKNRQDLSSIWYYWLKLYHSISGQSVYDEIGTSEEDKKRLTGEAKLVGNAPTTDTADEEAMQELTGDAEVISDNES
jgi:hypothetical protein